MLGNTNEKFLYFMLFSFIFANINYKQTDTLRTTLTKHRNYRGWIAGKVKIYDTYESYTK
jgi:hypothetical protein